jgi:hypothetical protein
MATIKKTKKAQEGAELRKGQYKRIGRIAERNPDRAERVAERMNTRANRVNRGKDIAGAGSDRSARRLSELRQPELKSNPYMELESIMNSRPQKLKQNPAKFNFEGSKAIYDKEGKVTGYKKEKNGGKTKMKNGGSLSGLKASNKRVGPIDPKGAYTKVQKKTLAGAKGKASLTKDKQLGATKMKMGGKMAKCKYGCK